MRQCKKKWVRRSPRVSPSTTAAKKRDPGCKNSRQQRNFFSREKHIHLVSMPLENIFAREAQKFKLLIGKVGSSKKKESSNCRRERSWFLLPTPLLVSGVSGQNLGENF